MTRLPKMSETLAETLHGAGRQEVCDVPLHQRLLSALVGGAVALSVVLASVMPARAEVDNRDLLRALVALGVIGVIANEVSNDRDSDDDGRDRPNRPYPNRPYPDRHHPPRPPHEEPRQRARIPDACAIEIEGRRGRDVAVYAESCLRDYGIDHLPRQCSREVRFYGRKDRVYPENCLREAGFRFGNFGGRDIERPD